MDAIRTDRTYKTRENALKALAKVADLERTRYLIAVTADGRFAPVAIGEENLPLALQGVTVVV